MSYQIFTSKKFDKSLKKCIKRGANISKLQIVVDILRDSGTLPPEYRTHKLSGNYAGCWECHIQSDWLLIWKQDDEKLTLLFVDTGSHSDLF